MGLRAVPPAESGKEPEAAPSGSASSSMGPVISVSRVLEAYPTDYHECFLWKLDKLLASLWPFLFIREVEESMNCRCQAGIR